MKLNYYLDEVAGRGPCLNISDLAQAAKDRDTLLLLLKAAMLVVEKAEFECACDMKPMFNDFDATVKEILNLKHGCKG